MKARLRAHCPSKAAQFDRVASAATEYREEEEEKV
jgi:hypothetical protein